MLSARLVLLLSLAVAMLVTCAQAVRPLGATPLLDKRQSSGAVRSVRLLRPPDWSLDMPSVVRETDLCCSLVVCHRSSGAVPTTQRPTESNEYDSPI